MTDGKSGKRVANDVGPAISGPLRRRKDGRWDWYDQSRRSLEAAAASWVVDRLEREGLCLEDLWSPDYDPSRQPEVLTRPELAMTLDGERTALDVTMFTTNLAAAAAARAARLRSLVETQVRAAANHRTAFGLIVYDPERVHAIARQEFAAQAAMVSEAFVSAIEGAQDASEQVSVDVTQDWVRGAVVTLDRSGATRRHAMIQVVPRGRDMTSYVDTFVNEVLVAKRSQLQPWGRGILVVVHGFGETAEDVAAGFARASPLPWWRVYWVGSGPEHVYLIAS